MSCEHIYLCERAELRAEVERLREALRWIRDAPFNKGHLQDHARRALGDEA